MFILHHSVVDMLTSKFSESFASVCPFDLPLPERPGRCCPLQSSTCSKRAHIEYTREVTLKQRHCSRFCFPFKLYGITKKLISWKGKKVPTLASCLFFVLWSCRCCALHRPLLSPMVLTPTIDQAILVFPCDGY